MSTSPEDSASPESPDPLDRLLLRVPLVEPDAWFAARTLARCRHSRRSHGFFAWGRLWPRWAIGGALGLFLGAFALRQVHDSQKVPSTKQQTVQEAFEVLASLDNDSDLSSPPPDSSF